ncbi:MAG: hypothetical protein N2450_05070 [bacterium]|nr:hypothetical protein [bacterium]
MFRCMYLLNTPLPKQEGTFWIPFNDELAHYHHVLYQRDFQRMPHQFERTVSEEVLARGDGEYWQPTLYYLLCGLLLRLCFSQDHSSDGKFTHLPIGSNETVTPSAIEGGVKGSKQANTSTSPYLWISDFCLSCPVDDSIRKGFFFPNFVKDMSDRKTSFAVLSEQKGKFTKKTICVAHHPHPYYKVNSLRTTLPFRVWELASTATCSASHTSNFNILAEKQSKGCFFLYLKDLRSVSLENIEHRGMFSLQKIPKPSQEVLFLRALSLFFWLIGLIILLKFLPVPQMRAPLLLSTLLGLWLPMSATINNDALLWLWVAMLYGFATYAARKGLTRYEGLLVCGVFLAAMYTKLSALPLLPMVLATLWLGRRHQPLRIRLIELLVACTILLDLLLPLLWFRNLFYGNPIGVGKALPVGFWQGVKSFFYSAIAPIQEWWVFPSVKIAAFLLLLALPFALWCAWRNVRWVLGASPSLFSMNRGIVPLSPTHIAKGLNTRDTPSESSPKQSYGSRNSPIQAAEETTSFTFEKKGEGNVLPLVQGSARGWSSISTLTTQNDSIALLLWCVGIFSSLIMWILYAFYNYQFEARLLLTALPGFGLVNFIIKR